MPVLMFSQMNGVRRERGEEHLLQISAVKTNGRHVRVIHGQMRKGAATGNVTHDGFDDRAAIHHLRHESQVLQDASRVCRKPDAGADLFQLRGALKKLDVKAPLPQSNGSSESTDTGADHYPK